MRLREASWLPEEARYEAQRGLLAPWEATLVDIAQYASRYPGGYIPPCVYASLYARRCTPAPCTGPLSGVHTAALVGVTRRWEV